MQDGEQKSEFESPLRGNVFLASMACLVSLILCFWVARPAVELLEVRWAELVAYAIIPGAVTFIILYRSNWHVEIVGVARTFSVLLASCFILSCELLLIGLLIGFAIFGVMGITGGNH